MLQDGLHDRIYCVIDGLDVYKVEMDELVVQLTRIFNHDNEEGPTLKLFCTSRPDKAILNKRGRLPSRILRCNADDLDIFIRTRVSSLDSEFTEDMRAVLMDSLRKQAEQTFLWLDVVIRRIRMTENPTLRKVEEAIEHSPEELETLYELLVTEALSRSRDNARILVWVVYARRPLDLKALGDAIAIDPQRRSEVTKNI